MTPPPVPRPGTSNVPVHRTVETDTCSTRMLLRTMVGATQRHTSRTSPSHTETVEEALDKRLKAAILKDWLRRHGREEFARRWHPLAQVQDGLPKVLLNITLRFSSPAVVKQKLYNYYFFKKIARHRNPYEYGCLRRVDPNINV